MRIVKSLTDLSSIEIKKDPNNCPIALREIKVTNSALKKLFLMAIAVNDHLGGFYEVYCLLFGKNGVIEDIFIPKQEADTVSVNVSEESLKKIIEELESLEPPRKIIGWAHSHGDFSVFSSSTDDENHVTLLNQTSNYLNINNHKIKFAYGLTVNVDQDKFGIVVSQYNCGAILQRKGTFKIMEDELTFNILEEYEMILETIKQKVSKKEYKWKWYISKDLDDDDDDDIKESYSKIKKKSGDKKSKKDKKKRFKSRKKKIDIISVQKIISAKKITDNLLKTNMFKPFQIGDGDDKFETSLFLEISKIRDNLIREIIKKSK